MSFFQDSSALQRKMAIVRVYGNEDIQNIILVDVTTIL